MDRKFRLINWLLFAAIGLIILTYIMPHTVQTGSYRTDFITGFDEQKSQINDSLHYYQYRLIEDSLKTINDCNKKAFINTSEGIITPLIGFMHWSPGRDCMNIMKRADGSYPDLYYMVLPGYFLQPGYAFYMEGENYFLRKVPRKDRLITNWDPPHDKMFKKQISVRYYKQDWSKDEISTGNDEPGDVLAPVTTQQYKSLRVLVYIIGGLLFAYGIWIIGVLPLRILFAIAKGQPFLPKISRYFFIIGWSLIGLSILPVLCSLVLNFCFHSKIPAELFLDSPRLFLQYKGLVLGGLIAFLLGRAFQEGAAMHEDYEFTA